MRIGIPREIKDHEYRVGAIPAGVRMLVAAGHEVWVERAAGLRIGFDDGSYAAAGARIVDGPEAVYDCPMVVKVKEPQAQEFGRLHNGQVLFTYLHLAPDPVQTAALLGSGVTGIAYETVSDARGRLPLLTPMSEVAGRIAVQAGAAALEIAHGGRGVLLGGVPGVAAGRVTVVGGGVVGTHAARMALGLGAQVTVLDIDLERLRQLDESFGHALHTRYADGSALEEMTAAADLVVGAVLVPGKQAPKVITRAHVANMPAGSVLVDVAIDQGGCAQTSRPTSHSEPTYTVDGVVHYCVTNMPGACARTATLALTNATLPYVLALADKGVKRALHDDPGLRCGLNVCAGRVTHPHVAQDLGYAYHRPDEALEFAPAPDKVA
ncbi:MAG: alanine dehydrogenase [Gammaproteobacteria bacterium]